MFGADKFHIIATTVCEAGEPKEVSE